MSDAIREDAWLHGTDPVIPTVGPSKRRDVDMDGTGWHRCVHVHDDSIRRHLRRMEQTRRCRSETRVLQDDLGAVNQRPTSPST